MKLAVITGGGTGIGRSQAIYLATKSNATVILVGRRKEPLEAVQQDIGATNCHILPGTDIGNVESWKRIVAKVEEIGGGELHILCNTAGAKGEWVEAGAWDNVAPEYIINYNTTYISGLQLSYHFMVPLLEIGSKSSGKPSIITNMSSLASVCPRAFGQLGPMYVPCKSAMEAITRCAHNIYKSKSILSYGIHPGVYESQMAHDAASNLGVDVDGFSAMFNPFPVIGNPDHIGAFTIALLEGSIDPAMNSGEGYIIVPWKDGTKSMVLRMGAHRATQDSLDPLIFTRVWSELQEAYNQDGRKMPQEEVEEFRHAMKDKINKMEETAATEDHKETKEDS